MENEIIAIDGAASKTNSSYGNWAVGIIKRYHYKPRPVTLSEFVYFFSKKEASEFIKTNITKLIER